MSAKKKTIIIAVIAVLVVAFIAVAFLATQKSADYYTQIDNDCVTEIAPHGQTRLGHASHTRQWL